MSNAILLGANQVINATASNEVGGDYVAANLYNVQPSETWRGSTADATFTGSFSEMKIISGFALGNFNLSGETVRLELALDSGYSNIVYDNSWPARNSTYGWGQGTWGNLFSTWGGYGLTTSALSVAQLIVAFTGVGATHWRVTVSDMTVSVPEIGTLFLGTAFQPAKNISRSPLLAEVDPSEVIMTRGQSMRSIVRRSYREMAIDWPALTADEAMTLRRIFRETGLNGLVVFDMLPDESSTEADESRMLARMVSWDGPTRRGDTVETRYSASVTLREAL